MQLAIAEASMRDVFEVMKDAIERAPRNGYS